ncbi:hypothetical protein PFISCL1PPCAC_4648, partial [Pristionchus fissidentatus]
IQMRRPSLVHTLSVLFILSAQMGVAEAYTSYNQEGFALVIVGILLFIVCCIPYLCSDQERRRRREAKGVERLDESGASDSEAVDYPRQQRADPSTPHGEVNYGWRSGSPVAPDPVQMPPH